LKIEEILAAKSQALDTHNSHPAQIKKQINKAFELACQLNFCNYNKLNFAAQVMCDYVLFSIKSTLDAMSRSFDDESYSTVEVLSRVSIEYSVNLMYVLVEDTKSRSLAFLNKYVTSKKKNSQNWLVAAKSENDLKRVRLASYLKLLRNQLWKAKALQSKRNGHQMFTKNLNYWVLRQHTERYIRQVQTQYILYQKMFSTYF
jgi:hypothetical protein